MLDRIAVEVLAETEARSGIPQIRPQLPIDDRYD